MRRMILSSGLLARLLMMTLAAALAAVILGATAFAQGNASQDQYAQEPTQSEPSSAPATDTLEPETTASSSPDVTKKSPTPETTASSSPDASQKSKSSATGTTPAQTSDTTAPTAPNASQECPWEPIPPGAYPGSPSGCPWWRGTPGGSSRVHPTRGQLPEGQCYDTQLGVIYSCSGKGQPQKPSQPGQLPPPPGLTPPQPPPPPVPWVCLGGILCNNKPIPGRSPEEVEQLNRQMEKELERFRATEDCGLALSLRIPIAGQAL